jgi:hypothetical protein
MEAPTSGVPLAAIIITFSVFMTSLVAVYAWLLRRQYKAGLFKETKKSHLLEKRDDYNDKFSFLEKQQVSVSTI